MNERRVNIILLTRNRQRLTRQALQSICKFSSPQSFNLTVVDDGSDEEEYASILKDDPGTSFVRVENSGHNLGALKNLGVYWSERRFGRDDWLAVLDNDVCFIDPNWMERVGQLLKDSEAFIIGGCRHPYHGVNETETYGDRFLITDAVAGYSHFMTWETWASIGPYVETGGEGINRSEDFALSRKAVLRGYPVGYIDPPVLVHTGLTNSEGKPAVGSDQFLRVPGVVYE